MTEKCKTFNCLLNNGSKNKICLVLYLFTNKCYKKKNTKKYEKSIKSTSMLHNKKTVRDIRESCAL